jgi:hypothetical protein
LQTSPDLYPAKLRPETLALAEEAAKKAEEAWGTKAVAELEAEDKLSIASEKVGAAFLFLLCCGMPSLSVSSLIRFVPEGYFCRSDVEGCQKWPR